MGYSLRAQIKGNATQTSGVDATTASRRVRILSGLIVLAAVLAQYFRVINYDFLPYDDSLNITENIALTKPGSSEFPVFWLQPLHKLYIPLTYTVWGLVAKLARVGFTGDGFLQFSPVYFHATNLILHSINALLVLLIIRRFIKKESVVLLAALFFALHPIQVEAVTWITGMKDLLSGTWVLLSLFTLLRSQDSERSWNWLIVSTIFYGLALLSKPAALALPLMAMILGLVLNWPKRRLCFLVVGWALLALPLVIVTYEGQASTINHYGGMMQRLVIACYTICFYLSKILWPRPLLLDYGATPDKILKWSCRLFAISFTCISLLLVLIRRSSGLLLSYGLFLAALVPVLGLIPFEFQSHSTVADRYVYLSMLGVATGVAFLLSLAPRYLERIAWLILLGYVFISSHQLTLWQNAERLFSYNARKNPGSIISWQSLGASFMSERRWDDAIRVFNSAISLRPRFGDAIYNLGLAYERLGRCDEALEEYSKIVSSGSPSLSSLQGAVRCARRLGATQLATQYMARAEQLAPDDPINFWLKAELLTQSGQLEMAKNAFELAVHALPESCELGTAYADFLADHGFPQEAIVQYQRVLSINPDVAATHINFGALLASLAHWDEAERNFRKGIQLDASLAAGHVNLAVLLEQQGRKSEALMEFKKALAIEPDRSDAVSGVNRLMRP